ncbi:hypothetical protein BOX15_Mlig010835g3 [Macrostomum lignano]|uniref:RING-type domain-containing protein n=1 Tax=Macrostomum lignano TaxID=282301 RepID=A0A267GLD3_9PLAT|nr:hypothetical protein BOX15_Mlig010835g3 [Macrostomum lignano]
MKCHKLISSLLCLALLLSNCSCQTHLTRSVSGSGISVVGGAGSSNPADLMAPTYHRRQDEYSLAVNCTPGLSKSAAAAYSVEQPPPAITIAATAAGATTATSSPARLNWLVRPADIYELSIIHKPIIAFNINPNCQLAYPAASTPSNLFDLIESGNFVALVSARVCTLLQLVQAVRQLSPFAKLFLLRDIAERAPLPQLFNPADEASLQHPPGLYVLAYTGQAGSPSRLAEDLLNRSCSISINYRLSMLDNLINKTSVLFVSVSFILLMIISLSWLVFYYVQRFRYLHAKERLSRRLGNAAKKALTMIPVRILKPGDKDFVWIGDQCAVCIEPYRVSDAVRILPCKHFYHRSCIDPWLLDQRNCPLCKLDILKAVGLALRDRRQRRRRGSSDLESRIPSTAAGGAAVAGAAAPYVDSMGGAASVEDGVDDYYSLADSLGGISSSGGGGIIGCLGGGARSSVNAASSLSDPGSPTVAAAPAARAFADVEPPSASANGNPIDNGVVLLTVPIRAESPSSVDDEDAEVFYPLVHQQQPQPLNT